MSTPVMSAAELKAARVKLGLTTRALAVLLGTTERTTGRWENGRFKVPAEIAHSVQALLREADFFVADLVKTVIENDRDYIVTYRTDQECTDWTAGPEYPADWHNRVAARAVDRLRAAGREVRLFYPDEVPD